MEDKIRECIRNAIKETEFYKDLEDAISWWLNYDDRNSMIITGGYGIGKSTTVRMILEEKRNYIELCNKRLESQKSLNIEEIKRLLPKDFVLLLDDVKITKRSMIPLLDLWEEGYYILMICNNVDEVINADKIYNKSYRYEAFLTSEDLNKLKKAVEEELNIKIPEDVVILNLRDLISVVKYVLDGNKKSSLRLTIDEVVRKAKTIQSVEQRIFVILSSIQEKMAYLDEQIALEILTKKLGYSNTYAKKRVHRILEVIQTFKVRGKGNSLI